MGTGSSSSKSSSKPAATRRYSRSSGFTHWMDNMKDRRMIKIKINRDSKDPDRGTFTLVYSDDSSDDFQNIKSIFTYTGSFCTVEGDVDPFGIRIVVNTKGNVIADAADDDEEDDGGAIPVKRSESLVGRRGTTAPASKLVDDSLANEVESTLGSRTSTKADVKKNLMKFTTQKLVCKLAEGSVTSLWTIESGDKSDCNEAGSSNMKDSNVSWPWSGSSGRESHIAPRGALDFIAEEDLESGAIDLKIRIPQLAASWTPPVVVLTEVGGWKLEKSWR